MDRKLFDHIQFKKKLKYNLGKSAWKWMIYDIFFRMKRTNKSEEKMSENVES